MGNWWHRFLLMGILVGCSGKDEDDTGGLVDTGMSSPDAIACDARDDTGIEMVPGAGPDSTAPGIVDLNTPYTVVLSEGAGGWVRLVLPEAGTYEVHTGFAGVFRGLWSDTGERVLEPPRASASCPDEIPEVFTVTVTEPITYYMQLGPLASIYFWMYVRLDT